MKGGQYRREDHAGGRTLYMGGMMQKEDRREGMIQKGGMMCKGGQYRREG